MKCKKELSRKLKFCGDCKFHVSEIPWERMEKCRKVRTVHYDHEKCWYKYGIPAVLNKNNKCHRYIRKWWKSGHKQ